MNNSAYLAGTAVTGLQWQSLGKEINSVAHTFSTFIVKRAFNMPERKKKNQKKEIRDRSLYRRQVTAANLVAFEVRIKETDLMIMAERDLTGETRDLVITHRLRLEEFIGRHPDFRTALEPYREPEAAPEIVRVMCEAARLAGVGPMAAVAGAVSQLVGSGLREHSRELLIENGGDVYLSGRQERMVAIYTAERALGTTLGIRVTPEGGELGICTSSGRFGHSLSLGEASTATIIAPTAALADAAATAVGNRVHGSEGVRRGMDLARNIPGVEGAVIVHDGKVGAWGRVELLRLDGGGGK